MVKTDVRYDGEDGADDVRAVEPSAKPHFYHGVVHLLLGEILEGEGGCQFEEARMERFEEVFLFLHEVRHILFADAFAVRPYPFAEVHEMR